MPGEEPDVTARKVGIKGEKGAAKTSSIYEINQPINQSFV